jgi:hypothetical protein
VELVQKSQADSERKGQRMSYQEQTDEGSIGRNFR